MNAEDRYAFESNYCFSSHKFNLLYPADNVARLPGSATSILRLVNEAAIAATTLLLSPRLLPMLCSSSAAAEAALGAYLRSCCQLLLRHLIIIKIHRDAASQLLSSHFNRLYGVFSFLRFSRKHQQTNPRRSCSFLRSSIGNINRPTRTGVALFCGPL